MCGASVWFPSQFLAKGMSRVYGKSSSSVFILQNPMKGLTIADPNPIIGVAEPKN